MHNPARLLFYPQNDTKKVKMMYHKARFPFALIREANCQVSPLYYLNYQWLSAEYSVLIVQLGLWYTKLILYFL